jgi:hypothetical protein
MSGNANLISVYSFAFYQANSQHIGAYSLELNTTFSGSVVNILNPMYISVAGGIDIEHLPTGSVIVVSGSVQTLPQAGQIWPTGLYIE